MADIDRIAEWFWCFDDVAQFERRIPVPIGSEAIRESWKAALSYAEMPSAFWYIAEDAAETPVGIAGLQSVNYIHGDAIVPAFVAKNFRKRGLATAMTIALLDVAFDKLGLHRLTTFYRDDNIATKTALEAIGFKEEGRLREAWFADGGRKDVVYVGILGSEWVTRRQTIMENVSKSCKFSFKPTDWK
jgi:RimJ/RimL family protein N-acetyltransferase